MTGRRRWWSLAALSLASFLLLVDDTAVAVALPAIGRDLGLGLYGLEWVVNVYTLVIAVFILSGGTLADRLGHRCVLPRPRRAQPVLVDPNLLDRLIAVALGTPLELPVAIAAATGMRRGEILALRWADVAADLSMAHVQASLQTTRAGLVFERPKTARSRRAVALPAFLRPFLERQRQAQELRTERLGSAWQALARARVVPLVP